MAQKAKKRPAKKKKQTQTHEFQAEGEITTRPVKENGKQNENTSKKKKVLKKKQQQRARKRRQMRR